MLRNKSWDSTFWVCISLYDVVFCLFVLSWNLTLFYLSAFFVSFPKGLISRLFIPSLPLSIHWRGVETPKSLTPNNKQQQCYVKQKLLSCNSWLSSFFQICLSLKVHKIFFWKCLVPWSKFMFGLLKSNGIRLSRIQNY
jgi:hypothetical protein